MQFASGLNEKQPVPTNKGQAVLLNRIKIIINSKSLKEHRNFCFGSNVIFSN